MRHVLLASELLASWLLLFSPTYGDDPPAPPFSGAAPDWGYTFPALPAKTAAAKNLTVLIHGLSSDPTVWADGMRTAITGKLANAADWNLISYNWQTDAVAGGLFGSPVTFNLRNAQTHGQHLAKHILNQMGIGGGYEHAHFVAHSMGSRVVESATIALVQGLANNNAALGKVPIIHTTLVDAYTPLDWEAVYGKHATWAEHYWSNDLLDTNDSFHHAANFDITALDADPNRGNTANLTNDHQWPHEWYRRTVDNFNLGAPNDAQTNQIAQDRGLGFPLSKEAGHAAWGGGGNNAPRTLHKLTTIPADKDAELVMADVARKRLSHTKLAIDELNRSETGSITIPESDDLTLSAPADNGTAWINVKIDVPAGLDGKINFFKFDFDFTSEAGAGGILSFHLDHMAGDSAFNQNDKRFYDLLERFAVDPLKEAVRQASGEIFFRGGTLSAGMHTLGIRLDSAATASKLAIYDLKLGSTVALIPEPASLMLLGMAAIMLSAIACDRARRRADSKQSKPSGSP